MNKRKILVFIVLLSTFGLTAQEIVSYTKVKSMTKQEIQSQLLIAVDYDVDVYRITYTTKSIDMEVDTASGILAIPDAPNTIFPFIIYEHGTVGDRHSVPSEGSNEQLTTIVLAAHGYHCIAPDYIGLGISKGTHPYLHPQSEAWATIDLIKAVKTIDESYFHYNDQIFITGYSQGGHATMATCRALQDEATLTLTAAAPLSGPYSVSKEMKKFTLSDQPYYFCGYLGSVYLSAKYSYPDLLSDIEVEDLFKAPYASLIREFENEEKSLWEINNQMKAKLTEIEGVVLPKLMFKDEVQSEIVNSTSHPLHKALERMDVTNWIPKAPLHMVYCTADDQVTYRNAIYTDSLMHANGASNVSSQDAFASGDHSSCYIPAIFKMRDFFAQYKESSTVKTVNSTIISLQISPNPNNGHFSIQLPEQYQNTNLQLNIRDMNGRLIHNKPVGNQISTMINISNIPKGMLFVELINEGNIIAHEKLVVY